MTILVQAKVDGRPRTKGSLHGICTRNRTHTIHYTEQVAESKPWRKRVARALREAQLEQHGRLLQHAGPVEVRLVFFFPRTSGPAGETLWPTAIILGDIDKLTRNVLDAMLTPEKREGMELCSALLADDSQVVSLHVGKFWTTEDYEPGVQILVSEMTRRPEAVADYEVMGWGVEP